jgi:hypothetical protein
MMAEVLGIGLASLARWMSRQSQENGQPAIRGRHLLR